MDKKQIAAAVIKGTFAISLGYAFLKVGAKYYIDALEGLTPKIVEAVKNTAE